MKNKLAALEAQRELIVEAYSVEYDTIIKDLDRIIDKYFVEPFDAECIRRWIREDFYPERSIYINFDVGFHNVKEDRIDFGSDISFSYDSFKQSLQVNYGTCGAYSKDDEYQVKRVKTLAYVWENIDTIEEELNTYAVRITPVVLNHYDTLHDIDRQISSIEQAITVQKKNDILKTIQVGSVVSNNENWSPQRLFAGVCDVIKITPKFVVLKDSYDRIYRIKKEEIVNRIFMNHLIIK